MHYTRIWLASCTSLFWNTLFPVLEHALMHNQPSQPIVLTAALVGMIADSEDASIFLRTRDLTHMTTSQEEEDEVSPVRS